MSVIEIRNVSKKFSLHSSAKLLREHLANRFWKSQSRHGFFALQDISFRVEQAEGVQIVGANGAGKSTLLSVITGLAQPDAGTVQINGRVGALLELASGFHPDLTGAENLVLNAALIGINEKRILAMAPRVVEFAELADFIGEPLRTYSAGMMMRLAFAVAITLEPEILIVDEVLGVGDSAFQRKCFEAIRRLRQQGTALLCVSHGAGTLAELCSRVIWLHEGRVVRDGEYASTMAEYQKFMQSSDRSSLPVAPSSGALSISR